MRLKISNLCFEYEDNRLFSDLNWELQTGQLWHLQAGNGAGKTTLLRLLAGLLDPLSGDIVNNQQSIYRDLSAFQQQLCYVGHRLGIHAELTVAENCYFDAHWQYRQPDLPQLLETYQLLPFADQKCAYLSEGQKRRVALLRLAMTNKPLWLLDEPYAALDSQASQLLSTTVQRHVEQGGLVIMTSHQPLPFANSIYETYCL